MAFFDTAWYAASGLNPVDIGSSNNAAGATLVLSNVGAPAGTCLVVIVCEATATTDGSLADGGVNSYSLVKGQTLGGASNQGRLQVYRAFNISALATSITYTKAGSGNHCSMVALYVPNVLTSGDPVDAAVTVSNNGTSTTPSLTSGTPGTAGEIIICAFGANSSGTTYTQSTGAAGTPPDGVIAQTTCQVNGGWLVKPDTTTYVFAPTIAATVVGTASIIIGLKPKYTTGWQNVAAWKASASVSAGALVRQFAVPTVGNERAFVAIVGGTANSTEPSWTVTRGAKTTDNTVTWQECTGAAGVNGDLTNCPNWTRVKNAAITLGQVIQNNAGTFLFICSTAGTTGNGSEPSWTLTAGVATTDNTAHWTCLGAVGGFGAWAAPHARLNGAFASTWGAAGNDFYVADNHAEAVSGNITLTPSANSRILSVDHTQTLPPTGSTLLAGATVHGTGQIAFSGASAPSASYWFDFAFSVNFSGLAAGFVLSSIANIYQRFENCSFQLSSNGSGSSDTWAQFGNTAPCSLDLVNCGFNFAVSTQTIHPQACNVTWKNTATPFTNVISAAFVDPAGVCNMLIEGVDISAIGAVPIIETTSTMGGYFCLKDCKISASSTVAGTGTINANQLTLTIDVMRCDSGGTNTRNERHTMQADQTTSTNVVRTGGASDGATPISHRIAPSSFIQKWLPHNAIPLAIWNAVTGTNRQVTLYGVSNAAALPTNTDFWFDVEYLGSASSPIGSFASGGVANQLTTPSNWTADSVSAWDSAATARANTFAYAVGAVIKLASNPGRIFFCTAASGNSAGSEPGGYASAVDGGAVTDGSCTFRAGVRWSATITLSAPQPAQVGYFTIYPKFGTAVATFIHLDPLPVLG